MTKKRLTRKWVPVYNVRSVAALFGIGYTAEEVHSFRQPPDLVEGYITFFDPGWSIVRLREFARDKGKLFYRQDWYDDGQPFATLGESPRYRQLRMEAAKDSFGKTFAEQQKLLLPDEEIPLARVVVAGIVTHFLVMGERLFPTYIRCADKSADGNRVLVGGFDALGLLVGGGWDGRRYGSLGVAAARKF